MPPREARTGPFPNLFTGAAAGPGCFYAGTNRPNELRAVRPTGSGEDRCLGPGRPSPIATDTDIPTPASLTRGCFASRMSAIPGSLASHPTPLLAGIPTIRPDLPQIQAGKSRTTGHREASFGVHSPDAAPQFQPSSHSSKSPGARGGSAVIHSVGRSVVRDRLCASEEHRQVEPSGGQHLQQTGMLPRHLPHSLSGLTGNLTDGATFLTAIDFQSADISLLSGGRS